MSASTSSTSTTRTAWPRAGRGRRRARSRGAGGRPRGRPRRSPGSRPPRPHVAHVDPRPGLLQRLAHAVHDRRGQDRGVERARPEHHLVGGGQRVERGGGRRGAGRVDRDALDAHRRRWRPGRTTVAPPAVVPRSTTARRWRAPPSPARDRGPPAGTARPPRPRTRRSRRPGPPAAGCPGMALDSRCLEAVAEGTGQRAPGRVGHGLDAMAHVRPGGQVQGGPEAPGRSAVVGGGHHRGGPGA
jgi:hypothetical protein